jgi:hypothetical protein
MNLGAFLNLQMFQQSFTEVLQALGLEEIIFLKQ